MTAEEIAAALDVADGQALARPQHRTRGSRPTTDPWREAFTERTVAVDGGHVHWTGTTGARGTPVLSLNSRVETAYRLAFRWHHGREPVGNVRPGCDYPSCVAGVHLRDRVMRDQGGCGS